MRVLLEAGVVRIYVHDHRLCVRFSSALSSQTTQGATYDATVADEVVHEDLGELRVAEGHNLKCAARVARVTPARGREGLCDAALVRAERLEALAEDHERLVDRAGLLQTLAGRLRVLRALRAREIDERQPRALDCRRVL